MNAAGRRWVSFVLLALAIGAGGTAAIQWRESAALQREIGLLREQSGAVERLRAENARLKAEQVPAAEIERLRNDRAAVLRLRGEVENLKARVEQRAQRAAEPVTKVATAPAAVTMKFGVAKGGAVTGPDGAVDFEALRERFRALAAEKKPAELRVAWADPTEPFAAEDVKRTLERMRELAKETGLRFELIIDQPRAP